MFRRNKTTLNGVELPEDFPVTSIIGNVAISRDGRYAAVTRAGDLIVAPIPENGKIEVDGTSITYQKSTSKENTGSIFFGSNLSITSAEASGAIKMVNGKIIIGGGLEEEISEGYQNITLVKLDEMANNIDLGLSTDNLVYVQGKVPEKPKKSDGTLTLEGLEGKLLLPPAVYDLRAKIHTMSGNVAGDIAHAGKISTMSGDITLTIRAPVRIITSTMSGDVDVRKMMANGKNIYEPPEEKLRGDLYLETMSGDIRVDYVKELR